MAEVIRPEASWVNVALPSRGLDTAVTRPAASQYIPLPPRVAAGYLRGLAMRRIADLHPGQAKTDARIIAEAARTMPHTLRTIALEKQTLAELAVLCGFDDDLAAQITATSNRIRGLLTQIHSALERALGPHLDHPAVADLLTRHPTPAALKTAGPSGTTGAAGGAGVYVCDGVFAVDGDRPAGP